MKAPFLSKAALAAATATLLATGCSAGGTERAASGAPKTIPTRVAHAELASGVSSADELSSRADVVVRARAIGKTHLSDKNQPDLAFTRQKFQVEEVIGGDIKKSQFEVFFTGGPVESSTGAYMLEVEGQPQFEKGDEYLLYLLGPRDVDGAYILLGGSQGRYEINGEDLAAVPGAAKSGSVEKAIAGLTVSEAAKSVAKAK